MHLVQTPVSLVPNFSCNRELKEEVCQALKAPSSRQGNHTAFMVIELLFIHLRPFTPLHIHKTKTTNG